LRKLIILILAFALFVRPFGFAGTSKADSTTSSVELAGLINTSGRNPFWLTTNQWGVVPAGNAGSFRVGMHQYWTLLKNKNQNPALRAELAIDAVGNLGENSQLFLPQAFGSIRYGNWGLSVGRWQQTVGLADSTLGTGSYSVSGNSVPLPKVQLGLVDYTSVPFTKNWFAIKGFYSEGWFESGRPITSELRLHQKQLYGRLAKPGGKILLYAGFNHQVQWGGKSPYETTAGQMPKSFNDYLRVITGTRGTSHSSANFFDRSNRVGNHLGTIDFAIEIDSKKANYFFYRQNIYEDGSLYFLASSADGLNGVRIRRKGNSKSRFSIREVVFEGLYTKSQGGPSFIINRDRKRGKDNYFNHAQVRDGWSYNGRTIGTPFITPTSETIWKYPKYADAFTSNNRVWVLHTGLRGTFLNRYEWSTKLSYSSNAGVYDLPFPKTIYQFSGLLTVQTKMYWLGGTILKGSVATDIGELYPNSTGLTISLRKEGLFNSKKQESKSTVNEMKKF
jgi:hypothetical protein